MKFHSGKIFVFHRGLVIFPVLAGLILYLKTVNFGFTNWDDVTFIVDNRNLHSFSLENITNILVPGRMIGELIYIPVTYLSYFFEVSLFGVQPSVIHLGNLVLHLLNIFLVYMFINTITGDKIISFFTSLLFAVHPLQVEAVSWCMGRKDVLSTFFALIFLMVFIKYVQDEKRKPALYICSIIMFFLSVFAKPSVFLLPLLLPPLMLFIKCKINKDIILRIIPFFIISAMSFYLNRMLDTANATSNSKYIFYKMTFIPSVFEGWGRRIFLLERPSSVYEWFSIVDGSCITATGLVLSVSLIVLFSYSVFRDFRVVWFGMLFALIGFLPSLSYLSMTFRDFYTADRYGYFPLIGVFLIISSLPSLFSNAAIKRSSVIVLLLFALSAGLLSWDQIEMWRSRKSLWEKTLVNKPDSRNGNYGMATEYLGKSDYVLAEFHIIKAEKAYLSADSYYMHGLINENSGDYGNAMVNYRRAVLLQPSLLIARKRLGLLYSYSGQYEKGLEQFTEIIEIAPQIKETYFYCSRSFQMMGNKQMAEKMMQTFEELNGK